MPREYLKKATLTSKSDASEVKETVQNILNDIEAGGDAAALEYAAKFDGYEGNILLTPDEIAAAEDTGPGEAEGGYPVLARERPQVRRGAEADAREHPDRSRSRYDRWAEVNSGEGGGLLCAGRALQPYRQRHHDGDDRQGGRLRAHRRLLSAAPRRRHRTPRSSTRRTSAAPTASLRWAACRVSPR